MPASWPRRSCARRKAGRCSSRRTTSATSPSPPACTARWPLRVRGSCRSAQARITGTALMPGGIRTNLQRYVSDEELDRLRAAAGGAELKWKTPEQGAAASILVATSPLLEGVGGRYFEDCAEAETGKLGARTGVAAYALDPDAAARLWHVSADLIS